MAEEADAPKNRRKDDFLQSLSYVLVAVAAFGGFLILIDPQVTVLTENGATLKFGSDGFSQELKGAVVTTMLLGALTAVVSFWFGASKQGQDQAAAVSRIAEAAPVVAAAVVANAAPNAAIVTPAPAEPDGTVPAAKVAAPTDAPTEKP